MNPDMDCTLIGQLDSPYVRRVAVSAILLDIPYSMHLWSVGADQEKLRRVNPVGRAPAWLEMDGAVLTESAQIVEHFDDLVGPERALMPRDPALRRATRQWLGLLTGLLDKGIAINIERIFNAVPAQSTAWTRRCRAQLDTGLVEAERLCVARGAAPWLVGDAITHADIAFACFLTYLHDSLPLDLAPTPALAARLARLEQLPALRDTYRPFDAPVPA